MAEDSPSDDRWDIVILHTDSQIDLARAIRDAIRSIHLENNRQIRVEIFDDVHEFGTTPIRALNAIIEHATFVMFIRNEEFFTDEFHGFGVGVALEDRLTHGNANRHWTLLPIDITKKTKVTGWHLTNGPRGLIVSSNGSIERKEKEGLKKILLQKMPPAPPSGPSSTTSESPEDSIAAGRQRQRQEISNLVSDLVDNEDRSHCDLLDNEDRSHSEGAGNAAHNQAFTSPSLPLSLPVDRPGTGGSEDNFQGQMSHEPQGEASLPTQNSEGTEYGETDLSPSVVADNASLLSHSASNQDGMTVPITGDRHLPSLSRQQDQAMSGSQEALQPAERHYWNEKGARPKTRSNAWSAGLPSHPRNIHDTGMAVCEPRNHTHNIQTQRPSEQRSAVLPGQETSTPGAQEAVTESLDPESLGTGGSVAQEAVTESLDSESLGTSAPRAQEAWTERLDPELAQVMECFNESLSLSSVHPPDDSTVMDIHINPSRGNPSDLQHDGPISDCTESLSAPLCSARPREQQYDARRLSQQRHQSQAPAHAASHNQGGSLESARDTDADRHHVRYGQQQDPWPQQFQQRQQNPDPFQQRQTPDPFQQRQTPDPFQQRQTPDPFQQCQTPDPFQQQRQTPDPFQQCQTPDPFQQCQTPDPFQQCQTPDPFQQRQTPDQVQQQRQTPDQVQQQRQTPDPFQQQRQTPDQVQQQRQTPEQVQQQRQTPEQPMAPLSPQQQLEQYQQKQQERYRQHQLQTRQKFQEQQQQQQRYQEHQQQHEWQQQLHHHQQQGQGHFQHQGHFQSQGPSYGQVHFQGPSHFQGPGHFQSQGHFQGQGPSHGQGHFQGPGHFQDQGHFRGQGPSHGQGHFQGPGHFQDQGHFQGQGHFQDQGHFQGQGPSHGQGHFQGPGQFQGHGHFQGQSHFQGHIQQQPPFQQQDAGGEGGQMQSESAAQSGATLSELHLDLRAGLPSCSSEATDSGRGTS